MFAHDALRDSTHVQRVAVPERFRMLLVDARSVTARACYVRITVGIGMIEPKPAGWLPFTIPEVVTHREGRHQQHARRVR